MMDVKNTKDLIWSKAFPAVEKIIKERPYYVRGYGMGGILANRLIEMGNVQYRNLADGYFSKALQLSPNRATILVEWGKTDLLAEDYKSAEVKFKRAIEINPEIKDAHWWLGITFLYQEDKKVAKEEFIDMAILYKERPGIMISYLQELPISKLFPLANVYIDLKYYQEAVDVLRVLIRKYPQNTLYLEMLDGIYKKIQSPIK